MIVILEGIDNCGKNSLATMLSNKYDNVNLIEFPDYNTDFGRFIKKQLESGELSALSLQLLFSSERLSKVNELKEMSKCKIVITTRYTYSALAYGMARGIDEQLLRLVENGMPKPDKKIYLKISVAESIKRSKNPDILERDSKLLSQVKSNYDQIVDSDINWHTVNATDNIDNVFKEVEKIIFG